jgi:hypothetical protein
MIKSRVSRWVDRIVHNKVEEVEEEEEEEEEEESVHRLGGDVLWT